MPTLTDDELTQSPGRLLDEARHGAVTIVTAQGQPLLATLPLTATGPAQDALLDLAATLYDRELISLGRAARIAGLSYSEMIDELGRREIATIRLTPEELQSELAHFGP